MVMASKSPRRFAAVSMRLADHESLRTLGGRFASAITFGPYRSFPGFAIGPRTSFDSTIFTHLFLSASAPGQPRVNGALAPVSVLRLGERRLVANGVRRHVAPERMR